MRQFSDIEKSAINRMIDIDAKNGLNVFANITQGIFNAFHYYIDINTGIIHIEEGGFSYIEREGGIPILNYIAKRPIKDVIIICHLIDYLVKEGLIYTTEHSSNGIIGVKISNAKYQNLVGCIPKEAIEFIKKYINVEIVVTPSLIRLKNNDFKSDEEIRNDKQDAHNTRVIIVSTVAMIISVIAMIVNAAINGHNSCPCPPSLVQSKSEGQLNALSPESVNQSNQIYSQQTSANVFTNIDTNGGKYSISNKPSQNH